MAIKEDRRVQKTKQQASSALISLIIEKGFESITVQDILDRANMGRSTFYSHFRDKNDLLLNGFKLLQKAIEEKHRIFVKTKASAGEITSGITLELFTHAESHLVLFKAMVGKESGQAVNRIAHDLLLSKLKKHLAEKIGSKKHAVQVDFAAHWAVDSFLATLSWWLGCDCPMSAIEINRLFLEITLPGMKSLLGTDAFRKL